MKNIIREYFFYSKLERNGILVLSVLCLTFFLIPRLIEKSATTKKQDFSNFEKEILAFEENSQIKRNSPTAVVTSLFYFNPNTISEEDLLRLGIKAKTVKTFLNYRTKGGQFFKKEDFRKVYGINSAEYERLKDYIRIDGGNTNKKDALIQKEVIGKNEINELFEFDPNDVSKQELLALGFSEYAAGNLLKFRSKGGTFWTKDELSKIYGVDEVLFEKLFPFIAIKSLNEKKSKSLIQEEVSKPFDNKLKEQARGDLIIDINKASEVEWQKLSGIGAYRAKSIVKFRNKLGGFYSVKQVAETYNLPDSTFNNIEPYLKLRTPLQKININLSSEKELANHPYIDFKQARIIINYRDQHGSYQQINDLKNIKILKAEWITKITPYLSFD